MDKQTQTTHKIKEQQKHDRSRRRGKAQRL